MRTTIIALMLLAASFGTAAAEMDDPLLLYVAAERFEALTGSDGEASFAWDVEAWLGTTDHKLYLRSESEAAFGGETGGLELQALYRRPISTFFDLQVGLRHDLEPTPQRSFAVAGLQGLAPWFVEIDTNAFLSEEGNFSGRVEADYDLYLTQRLVLQPSVEINASAGEDAATGIGRGLNDIELGLRLRHEFTREFAPYIGVVGQRSFGGTADLARADGGETSQLRLAIGVSFWF